MKNFNTNTKNKEEWLTPPEIVKALGEFYLDPCAPCKEKRPWETALHYYSLEDDGDGLSKPWAGRVWCNPPYGRETFKWLDKLSEHSHGGIALIFARTETIGFHKTVWEKADSVFFFKGRLKFYHVNGKQGGTANAPSCLVSYSCEDTMAIYKAMLRGDIKGKLVKLKH